MVWSWSWRSKPKGWWCWATFVLSCSAAWRGSLGKYQMKHPACSLVSPCGLWQPMFAPLQEDRGVPNDPDKTMHNDMAMTAMSHSVTPFCGSWISFSGPLNACGHSLSRLRTGFNLCLFLSCYYCVLLNNFWPLHLKNGSQVCAFIALPSCVRDEKCAEDVSRTHPSYFCC